MPELPEVETTRCGIAPSLEGGRIVTLRVRERRLRWPVPEGLEAQIVGAWIQAVERRAKYLLLRLDRGTLILHLGMSGSLRLLSVAEPPQRHDHLDLVLEDGSCMRLRDPRRFGAVLWWEGPVEAHPLLRNLGPEPLGPDFDGAHLARAAAPRRITVKGLIMDNHVVVGVGNIYANESLFLAGIHPQRSCRRISALRYERLATAIRQVLSHAIAQGGTTLRDFRQATGRPGYFSLSLQVYGRTDTPCPYCSTPIQMRRIGQRSSFFCPSCQH